MTGPPLPGSKAYSRASCLEACVAAGDVETGLATADEALEMGGGAQLWGAEARRLRAEFHAALGAAPREVEADLLRSIEVAERQGARSIERRAREDLDRLRARRLRP